MAEKLFEAYFFESLQAVYADATIYKDIAHQEFSKALREYDLASEAYCHTFGVPKETSYALRDKMIEKHGAFSRAEAKYKKAVKYLEAVQALLETENS